MLKTWMKTLEASALADLDLGFRCVPLVVDAGPGPTVLSTRETQRTAYRLASALLYLVVGANGCACVSWERVSEVTTLVSGYAALRRRCSVRLR